MKKILILLFILLPLAVFFFLRQDNAKAQEPGLLLHETFENLNSIQQNGGTVQGSINFEPGQVGNAANLNGGRISYPYLNHINPQEGRIEFDYKVFQGRGGLIDIGTDPLNTNELTSWLIFTNGGATWAEWPNQVNKQTDLTAGLWHHVKVTWRCKNNSSANFIVIYVDGNQGGNSQISNCRTFSPGELITVGWSRYYQNSNATFDELKIYGTLESPSFTKPVSSGPVRVEGGKLKVGGQDFFAKALGYQPTPIGLHPNQSDMYCQSEIYNRDLPNIRDMNANVIRTWRKIDCLNGTANTAFLDAAWNNGNKPIRLIMGFWVNYGTNFADPIVRNNLKTDFRNYVARYKNHPAVLTWAIGNENNLQMSSSNFADFYSLANEMAQEAYIEEGLTYHPVTIVNSEIGNIGIPFYKTDDASLPYVDIWGSNVYRGLSFGNLFEDFDSLTSKPLLITEYGIDSFNNQNCQEYQNTQATWDVNLFNEIQTNSAISVGASLMEYSDEWWKSDNPTSNCSSPAYSPSFQNPGGYQTGTHPDGYSNEEWWGIISVSDNGSSPNIVKPRQVYFCLKLEFSGIADSDCDGFSNGIENYIGTNPNLNCGLNAWPVDFDDDTYSDISDIAMIAKYFGQPVPPAPQRFDLDKDGFVDISDIAIVAGYFGKTCSTGAVSSSAVFGGSVTDSQTNQPITQGQVTLTSNTTQSISLNQQGYYYFIDPPIKQVRITVSAPGYGKETKTIKPEPTKPTILNFTLRKEK